MTVYEKIKDMTLEELSEFMFRTERRYDVFDCYYCRYQCIEPERLDCIGNSAICPYGNDILYGVKGFLNEEYERISELVYGKE